MNNTRALMAWSVALTCTLVLACGDDENGGSSGDGGAGTSGAGSGGSGGAGQGGGAGTSGAGSGGSGGTAGTMGGTGGSGGMGGATGGSGGTTMDAGTDAGDDAGADLTDAQIMAVTSAANMGEIMQANAAMPKLTDEDAQEFAMMMIEMHTAAQMRQMMLAEAKNITPQPNALSMELTTESQMIVAEINAASEEEVDQLYMEAQVMVHEKVLETIEDVLIPSADDPDLVEELETSRDEVEAHLEMAQEIVDAL